MSRKIFMVLFILLLLVVYSESTSALNEFTGTLGVFYGKKNLDTEIFSPADSQTVLGFHLEMGMSNWFALPLFDIYVGRGLGSNEFEDFESWTTELSFGLQREWFMSNNMALVTGIGLSHMIASFKGEELDYEQDSALGNWFKIGIHMYFGGLELGLDWMQSNGNITLYDQEVNAGGSQIIFVLGFHWLGVDLD